MQSTMQSSPLLIREILRHGAQVHPDAQVRTFDGATTRRTGFREVAERSAQLAHGLAELGVQVGDRVGTFLWNTQEHQECYLAIPSMGAVLHTLNLRLFPDQLAFVVNHAQDTVIIVDATVLPLLLRVLDTLTTVERFVVVGDGDASGLPADRTLRYCMDYDLWIRLFAAARVTRYIPEVVACARYHTDAKSIAAMGKQIREAYRVKRRSARDLQLGAVDRALTYAGLATMGAYWLAARVGLLRVA